MKNQLIEDIEACIKLTCEIDHIYINKHTGEIGGGTDPIAVELYKKLNQMKNNIKKNGNRTL